MEESRNWVFGFSHLALPDQTTGATWCLTAPQPSPLPEYSWQLCILRRWNILLFLLFVVGMEPEPHACYANDLLLSHIPSLTDEL